MLVNGWAWIGAILLPIVGANWFTVAATTWLTILWMPFTPEKLVTIPMAIWIHTKLFGKKGKTHYKLVRMYAEAKRDWRNIMRLFKKEKLIAEKCDKKHNCYKCNNTADMKVKYKRGLKTVARFYICDNCATKLLLDELEKSGVEKHDC